MIQILSIPSKFCSSEEPPKLSSLAKKIGVNDMHNNAIMQMKLQVITALAQPSAKAFNRESFSSTIQYSQSLLSNRNSSVR